MGTPAPPIPIPPDGQFRLAAARAAAALGVPSGAVSALSAICSWVVPVAPVVALDTPTEGPELPTTPRGAFQSLSLCIPSRSYDIPAFDARAILAGLSLPTFSDFLCPWPLTPFRTGVKILGKAPGLSTIVDLFCIESAFVLFCFGNKLDEALSSSFYSII